MTRDERKAAGAIRDAQVIQHLAEGKGVAQIARLFRVSRQRIQQIRRRARDRAAK